MRRALILAGLALVALGAIACKKEKAAASGGASGAAVDPVIAAWKQAGLQVGELKDDKPIAGGHCRAGQASGLDIEICDYADAAAAKKAETDGLALVGETTGLAIAEGTRLLVVADRGKADVNGKRMNDLARTFRDQSKK